MSGKQALTGVALLLTLWGCSPRGPASAIPVGSKNFTQQVVLGEIVAQHLEHRLRCRIECKLNLGGPLLAHQALQSHQIDLYPEYTGTALAAILEDSISTDPATVLKRVRSGYLRRLQAEWIDPLGIDNGSAMVGERIGGAHSPVADFV